MFLTGGGLFVELSDRKLKILAAVINNYIQFAEPVSSKVLCELLDFSVSSATIRNELAELTELGLLEQPHTSAGRVPSHVGYRLYINQLMGKAYLPRKTKEYIDSALNLSVKEPEALLKNATSLLASMTNFAVVSTDVSAQKSCVKSIKLVQVSSFAAMLILTTSSGIIKNRLFRCENLLTDEVLGKFNGVLNEKFAGVSIADITPALVQTVAVSLGPLAFLMSDVFDALFEVARSISKPDLHIDGQTNLLLVPEFNQQVAVRLINFFAGFEDIDDLFFSMGEDRTRVFIGEESNREELAHSSIVVTRYMVNGENCGSIGVVGPTRMNYAKLIARLEYIADLLGEILNDLFRVE